MEKRKAPDKNRKDYKLTDGLYIGEAPVVSTGRATYRKKKSLE